jgi:ParB family transcriptional regulator, chromosome partitioning protein
VEELDIRSIRPSRNSLRSELHSVDELMASVLDVGLLEPIVVRPTGERQKGFEVVAGNRRLEACARLGIRKIPSHIVELDERESYEASLIENLQRRTLDPIEEAEAFKRYVDDYGYGGASELAKRIGKSVSYISRKIALLKLPDSVKDELLRRRKTPSIAQEFLSLDGEYRDRVAELIIREKKEVTHREVREIVRYMKKNDGSNNHIGDDGTDFFRAKSHHSMEQRENSLGRALAKSIVALRLCMGRLDDIYGHIDEDEWVVREILLLQRKFVHNQVDQLMNLRRKTMRCPPPQ